MGRYNPQGNFIAVQEALALVQSGLSIKQAIEKVGVGIGTYYHYKELIESGKTLEDIKITKRITATPATKPFKIEATPLPESKTKLCAVFGSVEEIRALIGGTNG